MASSNDFGMPVTNSPPNPRPAQLAEIPTKWMGTFPAKALALRLSKGPSIPLAAVGDTFPSQKHFRILSTAHALQQNWIARPKRKSITAPTMRVLCSRSGTYWDNRVGAVKCRFQIKCRRAVDGTIAVTEVNRVHTHELDGKTTSQSPLLPAIMRAMELTRLMSSNQASQSKASTSAEERDMSSEEEDGELDSEAAVGGDVAIGGSSRSLRVEGMSRSGGGSKRTREITDEPGSTERSPQAIPRKRWIPATPLLPFAPRLSNTASPVASGSGSRHLAATQYFARDEEDSDVEMVMMRTYNQESPAEEKPKSRRRRAKMARLSKGRQSGLEGGDGDGAGLVREDDAYSPETTSTPGTVVSRNRFRLPPSPPANPPPPPPSANPAPLLTPLSTFLRSLPSIPPATTWINELASLMCIVQPGLVGAALRLARLFEYSGLDNKERFEGFLSSLVGDSVDRKSTLMIAGFMFGNGAEVEGMSFGEWELFVEGTKRFSA